MSSIYATPENAPYFTNPARLVGRRVRFRSIVGKRLAGREGMVSNAVKIGRGRDATVLATIILDGGDKEPAAYLDSFEVL